MARAVGHVVIVGLGNIGSHLAGYVARLQDLVDQITLVDHDTYSASNIISQDIHPREVGKRKVHVVARRLRQIDPTLRIAAFPERVESIPRGRLRADVILGAVDSKAARQTINEIAWRVGAPYVDSGVENANGLARVTVYRPGRAATCEECAWSESDYASLEQIHWCGAEVAPATRAPAYLGAMAGALQAAECEALLRNEERPDDGAAREVVLSARYRTQTVTTYRPNHNCRFDHGVWSIERLRVRPSRIAMADIIGLVGREHRPTVRVRVEGHRFATRYACTGCGKNATRLGILDRIAPPACDTCSGDMVPEAFFARDYLDAAVCAHLHRATLSTLGFRRGDVVTVESDSTGRHFELGAQ